MYVLKLVCHLSYLELSCFLSSLLLLVYEGGEARTVGAEVGSWVTTGLCFLP